MKEILIIEDDQTIIDGLQDTLEFHDFKVTTAMTGKDGIKQIKLKEPNLVLLDVMLPGVDGFEVCKKIKQINPKIPVIMLTARSQENDKLLGFELGADDYVTKPFSIKILVARIKAVLNRSTQTQPTPKTEPKTTTIGNATINLKHFTITKNNKEHPLSPKEQAILKLLLNHPNEVIKRDDIIDAVWGNEYYPSPRTIDNFILKLRTKIEDNPKTPQHILTAHGAGYKYKK